ncbi:MAG: SGNH/GDSL hydrolase family protein [Burkholderiaceae bacterium]
MFARRLGQAALSLCLLAPFASQAGPYSGIYVFGDSLSDGGSDFALSSAIHALNPAFPVTPGAPADFMGRFSNGKVAVDYLATSLGLALTPHYLTPPFLGGAVGGNNYAQGGATSGLENASLPGTLPGGLVTGFKGMTGEVNDYRASHAVADPGAVYVVWAGANDFIHPGATAILPACMGIGSPAGQAICTAATNVANAVAVLAALGAHNILVPNLPDLGKTASAYAQGPAYQAGATALTLGFNNALGAALAGVSGLFPRSVIPFDTFSLFNQILADPLSYGFFDTTHACLTGGSESASSTISAACAAIGQDHYIFWDGIHPTTATQAILGQRFAAALGVPEPSELALLSLGLIALLAARARRRVR